MADENLGGPEAKEGSDVDNGSKPVDADWGGIMQGFDDFVDI